MLSVRGEREVRLDISVKCEGEREVRLDISVKCEGR